MKSKFLSSSWCARLVIALTLGAPATYAQEGKWVSLPPFPEPHEEVIGQSANGKMYVFAGLESAPVWLPVGMVYEFDPATNRWTKRKPMALPAHHLALTEYAGKIYVFGGFTAGKVGNLAGWTPIDNAFEYDPETNSWRVRSAMPTPRNHTAAGAVGGKIYVIGGRIGAAFIAASSDLGNVEAYDPATDTWSRPLAKMPTARSGLDAGVYNGRIYVAGGENQDFFQHTAYHSFEAYDPATNTWSILTPMTIGRHGVAGGVLGNRFYAISGDVQSSGTGVMVSTPSADAFEFAK